MLLMTKELEELFKKYPFYSQEDKGFNADVVVKYFNPIGAGTWLITEGEKQEDGDWLFFGYCHIFDWEWGYVSLSDLENISLPHGFKIERELASTSIRRKVKDYIY